MPTSLGDFREGVEGPRLVEGRIAPLPGRGEEEGSGHGGHDAHGVARALSSCSLFSSEATLLARTTGPLSQGGTRRPQASKVRKEGVSHRSAARAPFFLLCSLLLARAPVPGLNTACYPVFATMQFSPPAAKCPCDPPRGREPRKHQVAVPKKRIRPAAADATAPHGGA